MSKIESFKKTFKNKRILVTGGTGSLGKELGKYLINLDPALIRLFSRDEEKQWTLKNNLPEDKQSLFDFKIGDIRDYHSVINALQDIDIVFNAAAMKQVPACEYAPFQAVQTNINGAENIVRAIESLKLPIEKVICISTDKSVAPVNSMGISKAMQEKIFIHGNLRCNTSFICARYGNILGSRGSLIPLIQQQLASRKPLTITSPDMTRFLMSLEEAIELILTGASQGLPGEVFIPKPISCKVIDIMKLYADKYKVPITEIGIRPGEKIHEILINEEELFRTIDNGDHYIVTSSLSITNKRFASLGSKIKDMSSGSHDNLVPSDIVLAKLQSLDFI